MRKLILISLATLLLGLALATPVSAGDSPDIESCDSAGNTKDTFDPGEPVYLKGSGLKPNTWYCWYIVVDHEPWILYPSEGYTKMMDLDQKKAGCEMTDSEGYIGKDTPVLIWTSADPGSYDVWLDLSGGILVDYLPVYDVADHLDNFDVGTAGFFVIPETPLGTIAVLLACLAAASLKRRKLS